MRVKSKSRVALLPRKGIRTRPRTHIRRVRTRELVTTPPVIDTPMSWPMKIVIGIAVTVMMTVPYHLAQAAAWKTPVVLPLTAIDRWIAFRPVTAWIYWSLFPLAIFVPLRFPKQQQIVRYAIGFSAMAVVSVAIFLVWPTSVPRPPAPEAGLLDWAYQMVVSTDKPTNACPSMHAAMAIFAGLAATFLWKDDRLAIGRSLVWVWAILILYATIATRQHVLWDLIAGGALGAVACLLSMGIIRKTPGKTETSH